MQQERVPASESADGFVLFDSSMSPIFVNRSATQILVYPENMDHQDHVLTQIYSKLLITQSSGLPALGRKFQSGRRSYLCRAFRVSAPTDKSFQFSLAVIFERGSSRCAPLEDLWERFHLTAREREVSQFLLQGLTSKEIAARMAISPNTVKSFLRLIMVKMGVSTRSGITVRPTALTTSVEIKIPGNPYATYPISPAHFDNFSALAHTI
jgi:DNA-binding CsgD family transcriptional regulator